MQGIIFLWFGSIVSIPPGWALCNGIYGTPDLRTRFILGAGDTYDPADTGGEPQHAHSFTGDGHAHNVDLGNEILAGVDLDFETDSENAVGNTDYTLGWPKYHALCYIMKLP